MLAQKGTLRSVLNTSSPLRDLIKTGAKAMKPVDVKLVALAERPRIGDSLDLDDATRAAYPQSNRWDNLLSVPSVPHIIGLEPHSARDSEVNVVIAKRKHAIGYLRNHMAPKHAVARWFWVSRGPVNFSKMDRARRQLDQNGISFQGRLLRSLD